jgi:hypothetical protein
VSSAEATPRSLQLDEDGDLLIERGQLVFTAGGRAISQNIRNRLLFIRGEWFLDPMRGVPYFEEIWTKQRSPVTAGAVLRQTIEDTPGVREVPLFEVTVGADRLQRVVFEAITDTGELIRGEGIEELSAPVGVLGAGSAAAEVGG